jgi:hypothetical protein
MIQPRGAAWLRHSVIAACIAAALPSGTREDGDVADLSDTSAKSGARVTRVVAGAKRANRNRSPRAHVWTASTAATAATVAAAAAAASDPPCVVVLGASVSGNENRKLAQLSKLSGGLHKSATHAPKSLHSHGLAPPRSTGATASASTMMWDRRRAVGVLNGIRPTTPDAAVRALAPHLVRLPATVTPSEVSRLVGLGVRSVQLIVGPQVLEAEAARKGVNNSALIAACRSAEITPDCPLPGSVGDPTMEGWEAAVSALLNSSAWMQSAGLPVV